MTDIYLIETTDSIISRLSHHKRIQEFYSLLLPQVTALFLRRRPPEAGCISISGLLVARPEMARSMVAVESFIFLVSVELDLSKNLVYGRLCCCLEVKEDNVDLKVRRNDDKVFIVGTKFDEHFNG